MTGRAAAGPEPHNLSAISGSSAGCAEEDSTREPFIPGPHEQQKRDAPEPDAEEQPMVYCPNCSSRLSGLRCKLVCTRCGYYMSCSDYV